MKKSALLSLLSGMLLMACGGAPDSNSEPADAPMGTAEAAVCSDGTCTCVAPDCDALNWTSCGKGGGTTTCSWNTGTTCATATCSCSNMRWICP
ncbi:hypothetical protein D7W79_25070 [Corallococcus exercitus]|uniref:Lipoprotein n=1 Tax=Corallococcus exercitus TaxID=2316736 RepID=A0A3A8HQX7_9BACT|nr:hypothetical protein [Corallococcus exercitus]NOK31925.1 hypothetical protein [Corallococcus exercitus]RKG73627.1 hypothetical protein D7W79_25070 [Corallococcus exercitus]